MIRFSQYCRSWICLPDTAATWLYHQALAEVDSRRYCGHRAVVIRLFLLRLLLFLSLFQEPTWGWVTRTDRPPAAWPRSEGHSSDPVSGWRSHLVHASILEEEEVTLIDIWNHKTIRSIPSRDPILLTVNLNYAVQCLGSGQCFREQRL